MPNTFANGKRAIAECDRCGFRFRLNQLRTLVIKTKNINIKVCDACWEPDHPQLQLGMYPISDPQALRDPRTDRGEFAEERAAIVPVTSYLSGIERTFGLGQVGFVEVTIVLPSGYTQYVSVTARNGYDGDVGIAGYIGSTPPFVIDNIQAQADIIEAYGIDVLTTTGSYGESGPSPWVGMGYGVLPDAAPPAVSTVRSTTAAAENIAQTRFFLPATTGDIVTVTATNFEGFDGAYTFTLVVGSDAANGDVYQMTGSARIPDPPTTQTFTCTYVGSISGPANTDYLRLPLNTTIADVGVNAITMLEAGTLGIPDGASINASFAKYGAAGYRIRYDDASNFAALKWVYSEFGEEVLPAWGTSDWCVEYWILAQNTSTPITTPNRIELFFQASGGGTSKLRMGSRGTRALATIEAKTGATTPVFSSPTVGTTSNPSGRIYEALGTTGALVTNVWQHIAYSRSGSTFRIFVDGVIVYQSAIVSSFEAVDILVIAGRWNGIQVDGSISTTGGVDAIDDIRVRVGDAVYTAAFTPPAAELP